MWQNIEQIKTIIKNCKTKTEVLNELGLKNNGGNYNTLTGFIIDNGIDIGHFEIKNLKGKKQNLGRDFYKDVNNFLTENSLYKSTSNLKEKLYKLNLKQRECEMCGQNEEWFGKKISLILDHINGDRHDNRLENLRIVCPNCNATLETHCKGLNLNKKDYYNLCECGDKKRIESKRCYKCCSKKEIEIIKKEQIKKDYIHNECECGKLKLVKSKRCGECNKKIRIKNRKEIVKKTFLEKSKETRKIERPSYYNLVEEINKYGYSATGRKYNVSDNCIRKWVKMYEKYGVEF